MLNLIKMTAKGLSASLGPKASQSLPSPFYSGDASVKRHVMEWRGKKKQVHNETLMRTHFRQSRGHNFGKAWGKSVFLNTPTAEELGAQFWISHICVVMHTPNVCSCSRYTCNLCIYLCKRTSHLCVKWKMWMWALSTVCNHEWKKKHYGAYSSHR